MLESQELQPGPQSIVDTGHIQRECRRHAQNDQALAPERHCQGLHTVTCRLLNHPLHRARWDAGFVPPRGEQVPGYLGNRSSPQTTTLRLIETLHIFYLTQLKLNSHNQCTKPTASFSYLHFVIPKTPVSCSLEQKHPFPRYVTSNLS